MLTRQTMSIRERVTEPNLNVELANLLSEQGLNALGEAKLRMPKGGSKRPDILVELNGIRIILEGRFTDVGLEEDCRRRIQDGLSELSVAVVYPDMIITEEEWLREKVRGYLRRAQFKVRIFRLSGKDTGIAVTDWLDLRLRDFTANLDASFRDLVSEDLVAKAVERLHQGIVQASNYFLELSGKAERATELAKVLQVPESGEGALPSDRIESLTQMAALALIDSAVFQEVLANVLPQKVHSLSRLGSPLKRSLLQAWKEILKEDYVPIFTLAVNALNLFPAHPSVEKALVEIRDTAVFLASSRALLRHDLMGRIYHTVLMRDIAKYYATYYTSVPAAAILANLALKLENPSWKVEWQDPVQISSFKVGDLACGSGTLLSAAYRSLLAQHIATAFDHGEPPDTNALHKVLLDDTLWGFDVLTYAAHLAATGLALHNPSSYFTLGNIFVMKLEAGEEKHLGSLDFFQSSQIPSQQIGGPAPTTQRFTPEGTEIALPQLPLFDIILMNPPFTRNVGGNLLFGDLPQEQREELTEELRRILKEKKLTGIGPAGLGAIFTMLAHNYLKDGGRLCLVIPRSLMSGVAWEKVRQRLSQNYDIEVIFSSHEAPNEWNFSENTNLSEILLVARRRAAGESPGSSALVVNLWKKPKSEWEAMILASRVAELHKASSTGVFNILEKTSASPASIYLGTPALWNTFGEAYGVSQALLGKTLSTWGQIAPFAQGELNRAAYIYTSQHRIYVPSRGTLAGVLPLMPLGKDGLGPDTHQIHSIFSSVSTHTPFRSLWGHESEQMSSIQIAPNMFLQPKAGMAEKARRVWQKASKLMVVDRLWLSTYRVCSVYLEEKALSNVWWSVRLDGGKTVEGEDFSADEAQRLQALWLNTTLGLMGILALRQDTRGAWVRIKQETLAQVPVLDLTSLTRSQIESLLEVFKKFQDENLPPLPVQFQEAALGEGIRHHLDMEVLETILGYIPDLKPLYSLLAREPILCLKPLGPSE